MRRENTREKDRILMGRIRKPYSTDVLVNIRKSKVVRNEAASPDGRSSYIQQHIMWEDRASSHLLVNARPDKSDIIQQQAFDRHILAADESDARFRINCTSSSRRSSAPNMASNVPNSLGVPVRREDIG